jgi:hypothetical protein
MADIVDDFIRRLLALSPGLADTVAPMLEAELRRQWGGTEPYVAKRPTQWRQLVIGQALREGQPVADAVAKAGIKRAAGYRILGRRNR